MYSGKMNLRTLPVNATWRLRPNRYSPARLGSVVAHLESARCKARRRGCEEARLDARAAVSKEPSAGLFCF